MGATTTTLETLHDLLRVAIASVDDLTRDDVMKRLLEAFARIPVRDRPTIVDVLEREATLRELSETTAPHTGLRLDRPNPKAQLYVRSIGPGESVARTPEHDRMVHASIEAAKQTRLLFRPDLYDQWRAALREALASLDLETRVAVDRLAREMLEALAETASR